jgi:hypothetical protein
LVGKAIFLGRETGKVYPFADPLARNSGGLDRSTVIPPIENIVCLG